MKKLAIIAIAFILPFVFAGCSFSPWGSSGSYTPPSGSGSTTFPDSGLTSGDVTYLQKIIMIYKPEESEIKQEDKNQISNVRGSAANTVYTQLLNRKMEILSHNANPDNSENLLTEWPDFTLEEITALFPLASDRVGFFAHEIDAVFESIASEILSTVLVAANILGGITDEQFLNETVKTALVNYLSLPANVSGGSRAYENGTESTSTLLVRPIVELDFYDVEVVEKEFTASNGYTATTKEVELTITQNGSTTRLTKENYYQMPKKQYLGAVYIIKESSKKFVYFSGASSMTFHGLENEPTDAFYKFSYKASSNADNIIDFSYEDIIEKQTFEMPEEQEDQDLSDLQKIKDFIESGVGIEFYEAAFEIGIPVPNDDNSGYKYKPDADDPIIIETEKQLPKLKTGVFATTNQIAALTTNILSSVKLNLTASEGSFMYSVLTTNSNLNDCLVLSINGLNEKVTASFMSGLKIEDRFPFV